MKDVLILVATGFEDTELISTINVFKRNNIFYDLVSIENKSIVQGQNEALVKTKKISDIFLNNYKSLFLPGGKGHKLMLENQKVIEVVKLFDINNKFIFAICAAPSILLKANIIKGPFTSYPGYALNYHNSGKEIEINNNIITARDYKITIQFANEIVKKLKNSI